MSCINELNRYKVEFERLYKIAQTDEQKKEISATIEQIQQQISKPTLSEDYIKMFCSFYGNLSAILLENITEKTTYNSNYRNII